MTILRSPEVERRTGLSRTSLWRLERAKKFPARVRLSANSVGWFEDQIEEWLATRPRGMAHGAVERGSDERR